MTPPLSPLLFACWPWLLGRLLILRGDVRAAGENCRAVLHEKPAVAQAILALWPVIFGLNLLYNGDALYAVAPHVYGWLHTGAFCWLHARLLGTLQSACGLWQIWALVWPNPQRETAMRRAMKVLCGMNAGLLCGFALCCPHGASWQFYALQTAGSVWCLWRLSRSGHSVQPGCSVPPVSSASSVSGLAPSQNT